MLAAVQLTFLVVIFSIGCIVFGDYIEKAEKD